jgi:hypothetical protein
VNKALPRFPGYGVQGWVGLRILPGDMRLFGLAHEVVTGQRYRAELPRSSPFSRSNS